MVDRRPARAVVGPASTTSGDGRAPASGPRDTRRPARRPPPAGRRSPARPSGAERMSRVGGSRWRTVRVRCRIRSPGRGSSATSGWRLGCAACPPISPGTGPVRAGRALFVAPSADRDPEVDAVGAEWRASRSPGRDDVRDRPVGWASLKLGYSLTLCGHGFAIRGHSREKVERGERLNLQTHPYPGVLSTLPGR